MASTTKQKFESLGLATNDTETGAGCKVVSYTHDAGPSKPVMTLIHGYPQSAFIWRYIVPELKGKVSLFVPELPGYGISPPLPNTDSPNPPSHLTTGLHLLGALTTLFPGPRNLILAGHDRGARICHRLAVALSSPPLSPADPPTSSPAATAATAADLTLTTCILLDILPTLSQWACFSSAPKSVRYFHWPFLASAAAPNIILSYGGGRWCRDALARMQGSSEAGRARFAAEGAWEVYAGLFEREETVRGSCADYRAGAEGECRAQEGEREEGRRVGVRTLVVYSERGLGGMGDVEAEWRGWVDGEVKAVGMGEGYGHYLPEECPAEVLQAMEGWVG